MNKITSTLNTNKNIIAWGISLLLILIYLWVANYYIVNIPYWDDYGLALAFLDQYLSTDSMGAKLSLLFKLDNEHRILTQRLVLILDYYIFGELDLTHIMRFGNCILIALWYFFYRISKLSIFHFLPVTFFFFVPLENIVNWEGTAFIHPSILLFSFLALFLLNKNTWKSFILAVICAFFATFTLGNGMFVFLAGFLVLLLQENIDKKKLLIWASCFMAFASFYFYGYHSPPHHPSIVQTIVQQPIVLLAYPCLFLGFIFSSLYSTHQYAGPFIGMFTILFTLGLVYFQWKNIKKRPVLLAILALLLFTIGIVALTRAGFGIGQAKTRRYQLMQVSFYSTLYITCFMLFKDYLKNRMGVLLLFSAFLYYLRMDDNISFLKHQRYSLVTSIKYYEAGNPNYLLSPGPKTAAQRMRKSINKGQFNVASSQDILPNIPEPVPLSEATSNGRLKIEEIKNNINLLAVKGWAFLNKQHSTLQKTYLVLQSDTDSVMFLADMNKRTDLTKYFRSNYTLDYTGFDILLVKKNIDIPAGNYKIGVYIKLLNGQEGLFFTEKVTEF